MDFMAHFTMGTGGHYITVLPADWSVSTLHDPLPSSCCSEKMLWNAPIPQHQFHILSLLKEGLASSSLAIITKSCCITNSNPASISGCIFLFKHHLIFMYPPKTYTVKVPLYRWDPYGIGVLTV